MSAAVEVSEGYSPDGRLFQRPVESLTNEQPRYLTFIGNLIDRETARQRKHLKFGGIEISNPCLRYVKDFIQKGRVTPLLQDTHNFVARDIVKIANEGDTSYFNQPIPQGYVAPLRSPVIDPAQTPLMGKVAQPGQQIESILSGCENIHANTPRGVVEIQALKHQPYRPQDIEGGLYIDPTIWAIQRAIFPTYPILPTLLDEIEAQLKKAWDHTELREIVEDMQTSLAQFRAYATMTVEQSHMNMREVATKTSGYIPQYTAMDLILLEQLGMSQRDTEFRQISQLNQGSAQIGEIKELFSMFLEANREERQELIKVFDKRAQAVSVPMSEPVIDETTMMAQGYPSQSGYSVTAIPHEGLTGGVTLTPESQEDASRPRKRGYVGASERIAAERAKE